jgi:CDP-diacylglycerol---glycerol-3-phosphate 3-phosphatidyltransferase
MQKTDYLVALFAVMVAGAVVVLYAGRTLRAGRFASDRADRLGGSAILGRWAMDMGYWALGPVVRLCLAARISANQLTWMSAVLGAVAGVLMALGRLGHGALVGTVASLCDALDGQVARRTGHASDAGEVLDAAVDRYTDFFLVAGLCVHYRGSPFALLLGLFALLAAFMISYVTAKAEALRIDVPRGAMRRHERLTYLLVGAAASALVAPTSPAAASRLLPPEYPLLAALALIAVVGNASALSRIAAMVRAARGGPSDPGASRT